ncbi:MAG: methyl-accepting chemotaxis protein [Sedimentibacter sp.]|uniref:methyl-accepting chemotaxis protein n=1 Tax=Sedimentibacter sp. TaxID=1960295 RepID=UPI0031583B20
MKLTIKKRLLLGFGVLTLILAGIGIFSIFSLGKINNSTVIMAENSLPSVDYAHSINTSTSDYRIQELQHVLSTTAEEMNEHEKNMDKLNNDIQRFIELYHTVISNETDSAIIEKVENEWNRYLKVNEKIISLSRQMKTEEAMALSESEGQAAFDDASNLLLELVKFNQDSAEAEKQNADKVYDGTTLILIIIIVASLVLSVITSLKITMSIVRPVTKLVEVSDELALGNVNLEIESNNHDEIGMLMESFKRMIENTRNQAKAAEIMASGDMTVQVEARSENDLLGKAMKDMIDQNNEVLMNLKNASEQVAAGANQISAASIALSQGATEQASSIEELTASLEEISAQTSLNAQNASQANELAVNAKDGAEQGNRQMKEMLRAMEDINQSSGDISKIIKVIDDIAFQTNILALNAAVEAARAGQHGKGFAVVAEEVRNLAARSAQAANETTALIENSMKKSEDGTKIAKDTANSLDLIVREVEKMANLVGEIANASHEQAAGLEQINVGVMQVSQVVQANSATSEESAAASQELSGQAQMLKEMVGRFKLKEKSAKIF